MKVLLCGQASDHNYQKQKAFDQTDEVVFATADSKEAQENEYDICWNCLINSKQEDLNSIKAKVKINCNETAFKVCADKWETYKFLNKYSNRMVDTALENIYGYPVIIKYTFGSFGNYVFLARNLDEEKKIMVLLHNQMDHDIFSGKMPGKIIYQPYLAKEPGTDITVYVVFGEVVACMKRANNKDFRSHVFRGGVGTVYELDQETAEICIEATKDLGLDCASINLLFEDDGTLNICEVNANPGLDVISQVTGVDVAKEVVNAAKKKLN